MQRFLFLFVFLGCLGKGFGQEVESILPYYTNAGLVYYYFWAEDDAGNIIDESFTGAFTCNTLITLPEPVSGKKFSQKDFQKQLQHIARPHHTEQKPSIHKVKLNHQKFNVKLLGSLEVKTVIYRYVKGFWISEQTGNVLYFNQIEGGRRKYAGSEPNTIRIWNTATAALSSYLISNQSYQVINHYKSDQALSETTIQYSQLKGFRGHDLTQTLLQQKDYKPKRFLLFVNGYRGPTFDNDPSKNEIYMNDRTNYWFNIDNRFMGRLKPDTSFYLDGSFTVKTSNHHTKLGFGLSYLKCTTLATSKRFTKKYSWLNTDPNVCGFDWRKRNGYIAGVAFLNTINNQPLRQVKDTLDIVCHSMGYAYTLGFLEAVQGKVVLRKLFILAPENANAGSYDWKKFQEVWQYGANFGQPTQDILCYQDGVAPQAGIKGLIINQGPYGRMFSPKNWPNKHFIHSHMVYSFDWIFDRIYKNQPGYVH